MADEANVNVPVQPVAPFIPGKQFNFAAEFATITYEEPAEEYFEQECWELYLADCHTNDQPPVPHDAAGLRMAREHYGTVVRNKKLSTFASAPNTKAELLDLYKMKVAYIESKGDLKKGQ